MIVNFSSISASFALFDVRKTQTLLYLRLSPQENIAISGKQLWRLLAHLCGLGERVIVYKLLEPFFQGFFE